MGLRKNMTEALELPKEIMLNLPLISLVGREEVTIENYKGILEYGEELVRIGTAAGVLRLTGSGLCLKQLSAECMVVTGRIENLSFLT
ncbi:MAG: sporulation protein YqfC [Anaerotignum sp.]|nr:sporulation protein YqfC [Anaerotignum sp.]